MSGHLHPLTIMTNRLISFFEELGFEVVTGPEIETEAYNFTKLNVPADHPARDEHDTFYLESDLLLRTHTSPMQLRAMEKRQPPVRLIVPGRVFRNEATDATHNHTFYQIEGLVIEENLSMTNLVATLQDMVRSQFATAVQFRLRPSYFPFVEPGLELDIKLPGTKWLEVLGAGMVHPDVLKNMNVDPQKYRGFAFGLGVERMLNLVSGVDDVRWPLSGDYRFLGQYPC